MYSLFWFISFKSWLSLTLVVYSYMKIFDRLKGSKYYLAYSLSSLSGCLRNLMCGLSCRVSIFYSIYVAYWIVTNKEIVTRNMQKLSEQQYFFYFWLFSSIFLTVSWSDVLTNWLSCIVEFLSSLSPWKVYAILFWFASWLWWSTLLLYFVLCVSWLLLLLTTAF